MINALRSEWIKLRTIRMNYVLVIIAVAFPLIVSVLRAALIDDASFDAEEILNGVNLSSVLTAMLLGVVGASTITGEFGFGTIRPTFAATPRRMRVIVAKSIVTVVVALVIEAAVVLICYNLSAVIATSRDHHIDLADAPNGKPAIVGLIAFSAIVAFLGFGLGLLVRSTPVAVAILVFWPLVAEPIVSAIVGAAGADHPGKWLPYSEGINMVDPSTERTAGETLGRLGGGLYFFAVAAAITVFGAMLTNRRDA